MTEPEQIRQDRHKKKFGMMLQHTRMQIGIQRKSTLESKCVSIYGM